MEEKKITKLEFLLSLEDHIICQRFFNVRGYKSSNVKSLDLYDLIEEIQLDVNAEHDAWHNRGMTAQHYLDTYFKSSSNVVTTETQDKLLVIYNRVFHENKQATSCSSCFKNELHDKLKKLQII